MKVMRRQVRTRKTQETKKRKTITTMIHKNETGAEVETNGSGIKAGVDVDVSV